MAFMKTIDFVTRTRAGATQYGAISADEQFSKIPTEPGLELSLNLRQIEIDGYSRSGNNLQITLTDGRTIVLEDYFAPSGEAESRLFISADGYLNEVTLVDGGDGAIYAQYGPTEQWGKWSPSDELIFLDDDEEVMLAAAEGGGEETVSMLGAGILGGSGALTAAGAGAAAVAAAAVIPGEDDGPARIPPSIDQDTVIEIGGDDANADDSTITISGKADPGSDVEVTIGDKTVEGEADKNGDWEVEFTGDDFPADGEHEVTVVVTEKNGTTTELSGPDVVIDTTPPDTAISSGTESAGDISNAAAFEAGIEIGGTGEEGATIDVTIEDVTRETTVGSDGTWTVTFEKGTLPEGEYETTVTVVSRDAAGNSTTVTDKVVIDTVANDVAISTTQIEGDGTINHAETQDGVTVVGTATPGAEVVVEIAGKTLTVTADGSGDWSATFDKDTLAPGTYDAEVTATSTDAAGNTNATSGTVRVDTQVDNFAITGQSGGDDGVINGTEAQSGFVATGTTEPGSTVVVTLGAETVNATVAADGSWTATFSAAQIAAGTYDMTLTALATDVAGNQSTLSNTVTVDTEAGTLTLNADQIGGDGTINNAEAQAGVSVTGTAEPGALVVVTLDGVTHQAVTGGDGTWSTTYASQEITPGTHTPAVTATITDAAGNTRSVDGAVRVDTLVDNLALTPPSLATATDGTGVINGAVAASGFDITGTVEPGSTVSVSLGGVTRQATVDASGNWTANFGPGVVPDGEYDADLVVNVVDAAGNDLSVSDTVRVDTRVNALSKGPQPVEADNIVNASEATDGATITGQVEPGSTVKVEVLGKTYTAAVDSAGNWSVDIPAADIPSADETFAMKIIATDGAGNSSSIDDTLVIDTLVPDQPDIVGYFRQVDGYRNATIETTQDDVTVDQVEANGAVNRMAVHESADAFLGETTYHFLDGAGAPTTIPDGSQLVITGQDTAGNAASTYVVLDEVNTNVVDLGNGNLGQFNIETVDLRFGDQSKLTIDETLLDGLSDTADTLLVRGGVDDTLTIQGATKGGERSVDGEAHTVYTFDNGTSVVVDDDINTVI